MLQIRVPWATPRLRFTMLFERLVIDWSQIAATSAVARCPQLSWDEAWGIIRRAPSRVASNGGVRLS